MPINPPSLTTGIYCCMLSLDPILIVIVLRKSVRFLLTIRAAINLYGSWSFNPSNCRRRRFSSFASRSRSASSASSMLIWWRSSFSAFSPKYVGIKLSCSCIPPKITAEIARICLICGLSFIAIRTKETTIKTARIAYSRNSYRMSYSRWNIF